MRIGARRSCSSPARSSSRASAARASARATCPANNGLSLRHTTRNFPNREGSKPGEGQFAGVCLMDARSIAATAANGGRITAATDVDYTPVHHDYHFDKSVYANRVYYGFGKADPSVELVMGPNITDWPKMYPLSENLLVELAAVIHDPVTTTDELIPSGETSSYRSNPLRLAEFTLSRRVPEYVPRAKEIAEAGGGAPRRRRCPDAPAGCARAQSAMPRRSCGSTQFGSAVFANKPGDGSAREQAASCQKVLGGFANICYELCDEALPLQLHQLGHAALHASTRARRLTMQSGRLRLRARHPRGRSRPAQEDIPAKVICADGGVHDLLLHVRGLTAG